MVGIHGEDDRRALELRALGRVDPDVRRDDRLAPAADAWREPLVGAVLHAHADGEAAALAPGVEKEARECQGWERGLDGGGARPVVLQPGAKTRVAK
jgi:hypothetical protein